MSLQHSYRPSKFSAVIGNENQLEALTTAMQRGEGAPRVFLITGASGCGKTSVARLIARESGCAKVDFNELDGAHLTGVDAVRGIRDRIQYKPKQGPISVWFLDEVHKLTGAAQENLLKPLEDTPPHIIFIMATTEPEKLKVTLKRRCHTVNMLPVADAVLLTYLGRVCAREETKVPAEVLDQIIVDSMGSPGIAMGILDTIIDLPPAKMLAVAEQQAIINSKALELAKLMCAKTKPKWGKVAAILKGLEEDPERVRRLLLAFASNAMMRGDESAYCILDAFKGDFFTTGKAGLVMSCYEALYAE